MDGETKGKINVSFSKLSVDDKDQDEGDGEQFMALKGGDEELEEQAPPSHKHRPMSSILRGGRDMSKGAMSGLTLTSFETGAPESGPSDDLDKECDACGENIGNESHFDVKCRNKHSLCNACFSDSLITDPPRCACCDCKFEGWTANTKKNFKDLSNGIVAKNDDEEVEEDPNSQFTKTDHITALKKQLSSTPIPTDEPCLVTGATGYVAGQIIKDLLEGGAIVHATVRDIEYDQERFEHLEEIAEDSPGTLKIFEADLMDDGSFEEAMEDCVYVFHVASPYPNYHVKPRKVEEELLDPAVEGTANICNQATETESVKRVILTSAAVACYTDAKDIRESKEGLLTESIWNSTASKSYCPYALSKVMAEKKAWKLQKQQRRWDLVRILPGLVVGPGVGIQEHSTSFQIVKSLCDGSYKGDVPPIVTTIVDVRDVSKTHLEAAFRTQASGRYLCVKQQTDFFEMSQTLKKKYGKKFWIPKTAMTKKKLLALGPMVVNNQYTRKYIRRNTELMFPIENEKTQKELGIKFRPMKWSLQDQVEQMIEEGFIPEKPPKKRRKKKNVDSGDDPALVGG